jgi:hypothetical protein
MGCGCKNKQQTNQQPDPKVVEQAKKQQSESIKDAIKKTVEKYYYTDKKTNGWVKG